MDSSIEIPYTDLSMPALKGLVEEFCTREGTDYGHKDYTLEEKINNVLKQLVAGKAKIFYNQLDQTINIINNDQIINNKN